MSIVDRLRRLRENVFAQAPHQRLSRALVKTLGYRALMIVITVLVAFGVTGNTGEALSIGLVANVVKTGTYYGYERLWDRISWGMASAE
ncbi:MAG: putative membrane protein [uncultured archaeon A07HN63]|nr:MAG: putative membrane protein [uncultured archaeon A07HN63]